MPGSPGSPGTLTASVLCRSRTNWLVACILPEWVPTLTSCWPFSNPSETHQAGRAVMTLPSAAPSVPNTILNKINIEPAVDWRTKTACEYLSTHQSAKPGRTGLASLPGGMRRCRSRAKTTWALSLLPASRSSSTTVRFRSGKKTAAWTLMGTSAGSSNGTWRFEWGFCKSFANRRIE
ncbi:hypothetical protein D3C86_832870 [compost metagenome]